MIQDVAMKTGKYIIGGAIPESIEDPQENDGGNKIYNTSLCFDKYGTLLAKHRKLHLFDANIPGYKVFAESNFMKPGPP